MTELDTTPIHVERPEGVDRLVHWFCVCKPPRTLCGIVSTRPVNHDIDPRSPLCIVCADLRAHAWRCPRCA